MHITEDLWTKLKKDGRPIVLYGMDNMANIVAAKLRSEGINISAVFASDGFVKDKVFEGCRLCSLKDVEENFDDFIILLCFGSHKEDVINNIKLLSERHSLFAPDIPVIGDDIFDYAYYEKHSADFEELRNRLADEQSRHVLDCLLSFKLSGELKYLFDCQTAEKEGWQLALPSDILLDFGAYTGDTAELFAELNPVFESIYAFEPEQRNFRKLKEWAESRQNVFVYNLGIGDKNESVLFPKGGGRGSLTKKYVPTEFICPDDFMFNTENSLSEKDLTNKKLLIKMDLEGWELKAIDGCSNIIKELNPNMYIAAYHRLNDLWEIPKKILSLNPEYKMYLRHSPCIPAWEINYIFTK